MSLINPGIDKTDFNCIIDISGNDYDGVGKLDSSRLFNQSITDFFKALGNEKRQQIILEVFVDDGEHNITEVAQRVKIAQSTASEHLTMLKRVGILVSKKVEKEVYYSINRTRIIEILDQIKSALSECCE